MKKLLTFLFLVSFSCAVFAAPDFGDSTKAHLQKELDSIKIAYTQDTLNAAMHADSARSLMELISAGTDTSASLKGSMQRHNEAAKSLRAAAEAKKKRMRDLERKLGVSGNIEYAYLNEFDCLGKVMMGLVALIVAAAIVALIAGRDWLKRALTDNTSEKKTIQNPNYPGLLLMMANSGAGAQPANTAARNTQVTTAITAAQTANTDYDAKVKAHDAAKAVDPPVQADIDKAKTEMDAAKKELDTKLSELAALLNPAGMSPGLMNSLGTLFPPTIEVTNDAANSAPPFRPSASRLLAFFSGLLLMLVGLVCACFYIYYYLISGEAPDLTNLTGVFIALGIGMAPYAVNKVANAATGKDKTI